ncbi:hypothetical protein PL81_31230 [Streptomyces sp. RSD-27]|nr:hypothetical protein PL81_31230 [Streptomyces sp. RSD-27]
MADTLPINFASSALVARLGASAPEPTTAEQAADCETLRAAREASHSESERIAYALAMVLVTHPGCCTKDSKEEA